MIQGSCLLVQARPCKNVLVPCTTLLSVCNSSTYCPALLDGESWRKQAPVVSQTSLTLVVATKGFCLYSGTSLERTSPKETIQMKELFQIPHRNTITFNANELRYNEFQCSEHFSSTDTFRSTIICLQGPFIQLNNYGPQLSS